MNRSALCLVAWLLAPVAAPAQDRLAPPTFQPGLEYRIRSRQSLETILGAGLPNPGKQVVDVTLELLARCRSRADLPTQREVSIRLDKVAMTALMGGLRMTYDSALPDSGETALGQVFRDVIGKSIQVTLDPEDRVLGIQGRENLAVPQSPFGQQAGPEQLIQSAMPMLTLGVPAAGAVPGQSWDHVKDSSIGPAGKLVAAYHVTYRGDEEGMAVFDYRAALRLAAEPPPPGGLATQPRIAMENGSLTGSMRVDKAKRFPAAGSGEGKLTLTVPNPAAPAQMLQLPVVQHRSFELLGVRTLE